MPYRESEHHTAIPLWKLWAITIVQGFALAGLLTLLVMGASSGCRSCNESTEADCLRANELARERYEELRDECRAGGRVWHESSEMVACSGWHSGERPTYLHRSGECWDR